MPGERHQRFERFLGDMIGGRHDRVAPVLSEDVVWHLPPFAKSPPLEGRPAVLDFLEKAPAEYYAPGSSKLEIELLTVDGELASCQGTLRATTRRGMPYENRYVFFARFRGELICEVWELMDTVAFQEQLRRRPEGEAR